MYTLSIFNKIYNMASFTQIIYLKSCMILYNNCSASYKIIFLQITKIDKLRLKIFEEYFIVHKK